MGLSSRVRHWLDATQGPPQEGVQVACCAPGNALYVLPDGTMRACCTSSYSYGRAGEDRLLDVWIGARRGALVRAISEGDMTLGCSSCESSIRAEGAEHAYPRQFDHLGHPQDPVAFPSLLGLYFANTCNLQCVQCHGGNSSSIRLHRDRLPPIRPVYDDDFFEDLRRFIAEAKEIVFAGGEPFLIPEAFRTWREVARIAPDVHCTIITNGTQWNDRVAQALSGLRASIVVSMDGTTAGLFESIRRGAKLDEVLTNLDRFRSYTTRAGTDLSINYCLMTENYRDFPDMLLFAEQRGLRVNVSVVREPASMSLYSQPQVELARVVDTLRRREPRVRDQLVINRGVWDAELERLRSWSQRDTSPETAVRWVTPSLLGFPRRGCGPRDGSWARLELEARSQDVFEFRVGTGDVILDGSTGATALLGATTEALRGRPAGDLWHLLNERFGRGKLREIQRNDDWSRFAVSFGDVSLDGYTVAIRDDEGWAKEASILFVVVASGSSHESDH